MSNQREGVFGKATAAFSDNEIQGHGSLHDHLAVWGTALTPDLLQKSSENPTLVSQIAKIKSATKNKQLEFLRT